MMAAFAGYVFLLTTLVSTAFSLECMKCTHMTYEGSLPSTMTEAMKAAYQAAVVTNTACQDPTTISTKETCGASLSLGSSEVWGCGKYIGEWKVEDPADTSNYRLTLAWRGCVAIPSSSSPLCEKPTERSSTSDIQKKIMGQILGLSGSSSGGAAGGGGMPGDSASDAAGRELVDGQFCWCNGEVCNGSAAVHISMLALLTAILAKVL